MDFADGLELLAEEGFDADIAYLDLGVSSMQIDTCERGFSYSYDAPLDMRMDPDQELDAREVVNEWDERRLAQLFRRYGEERYSRAQIARAIVRRRSRAAIDTTNELVETIKAAVPAPARFAGGHPAKRVFQAIRIAVNDELDSLDRALPAAWELLAPAGGWPRSPSTRSRTGASSASSPRARAAASARRSSRSASAATSPRPSSSPRAPVAPDAPARWPRTRARGPGGCAPRASSAWGRRPDGERGGTAGASG